MENLDRCFFCLKFIRTDRNDSFVNDNLQDGNIENSKPGEEFVRRISHYLKVPRQVLEENEKYSPSIKTCTDCNEISKNLSDSCVQLEVIRIKISHYLNELCNQIVNSVERAKLTSLQKIVHQHCILRVQKDEEMASPQIRLEKGRIPQETNSLSEFTTGVCENVIMETDGQREMETEDNESENFITGDLNIEEEDEDSMETPTEHPPPTHDPQSHSGNTVSSSKSTNVKSVEHVRKFHKCQNCELEFISEVMLSKHQKVQHEQPACQKCGVIFKSSILLNRHIKMCILLNEDGLFYCKKCDNTFERRSALQKHMNLKLCEQTHNCDECGLACRSSAGLRNHRKVHQK